MAVTHNGIKQTWVVLDDAPKKISPEVWEHIRKLFAGRSQNWERSNFHFSRAFYGNQDEHLNPNEGQRHFLVDYAYRIGGSAWCMPSREYLYSMGYDVAVPVEEDNVFSPRKVEIVA